MNTEYDKIIQSLDTGQYSAVYFLQGEEPFFIDRIVGKVENEILDDSQKGFNQLVMYGKDSDLGKLLNAARRYPMMGERQVVILKEAQEMRDWSKADSQQLFVNYLENPQPSTVLVIAYKYKTLDKRTKVAKALKKYAVFFESKKKYPNQIPQWIMDYCRSQKIQIKNDAVMMLAENIGDNLQRLANELDKLSLNLKDGQAVDAQMIQTYVGISKDYNVFELQKAIGTRNRLKALKIADYFGANPSNNPLVLTIFSLFSYFSKLLQVHAAKTTNERELASLLGVNPFFVKDYLQASRYYSVAKVVAVLAYLQEADLKSKGIGYATTKEGEILTELIVKIVD